MKESICKIIRKDYIEGTGFFCKIPFPDKDHMLEELITINHLIKEDMNKKKNYELINYINKKKKILNNNFNEIKKYNN